MHLWTGLWQNIAWGIIMLDINDFSKKQIIVYSPMKGDKLSYRNDNMIISNSDVGIKYQTSCFKIFMVLVIGDCTITTGLLRRAKKFGFSICFSSYQLRLYSTIFQWFILYYAFLWIHVEPDILLFENP